MPGKDGQAAEETDARGTVLLQRQRGSAAKIRDRIGTPKRLSAHHHPKDTLSWTIRGCQPASSRCRGNVASQRGLKSLEPIGNGAGRAEIGGLPDLWTKRDCRRIVTKARDGEGPGWSLVSCCGWWS